MNQKLYTYGIVKIWKRFTFAQKKRAIGMLAIILLNSIIDIVGLSSVLPAVSVVFNPNLIQTNSILNRFYNYLGFQSQQNFILFLFILAFLLILFRNAFSIFTIWMQSNFSNDIANNFSVKQLNYYLNQDLNYIKSNNSALMVRYVTIIPQHFSNFILQSYISIITEGVVIFMIIMGLLTYSSAVFLLMVGTVLPITVVFYYVVKKKIQKNGASQDYYSTSLNNEVNQAIDGYVEVKIYSKEDFFTSRFKKFLDPLKRVNVKLFVVKSLSGKIIELMAFMGALLILVYASFSGGDSAYVFGLIGVYFTATYRLIPTYNRVLHSLLQIKEYSYIFDILDKTFDSSSAQQPEYAVEIKKESTLMSFKDKVSFKGVSYKFEHAKDITINSIDLDIKKGEIIGIVGKSGSGKTTLINVLLRFMIEQSGKIEVDGVKLTDENIRSWRNLIGYVQQGVFLLDGNFYENIALGVEESEIDKEKLQQVIHLANLSDLINKLPEGLNTRIGENGSKLSGGQRQRVAIARALYKNAELLIFDEATSALDNETEKEITAAIDTLTGENKTMIIIAHRITTLKNCHKIYEMANGKIVGQYSYKEIIEKVM